MAVTAAMNPPREHSYHQAGGVAAALIPSALLGISDCLVRWPQPGCFDVEMVLMHGDEFTWRSQEEFLPRWTMLPTAGD